MLISRCFLRINALRATTVTPLPHVQTRDNWTSRRPSAIVNENEVFGDVEHSPKINIRNRGLNVKRQKQNHVEARSETESTSDKTLDEGLPHFQKLDQDNNIIPSLMIQIKSRKARTKVDQILLEGHRQIKDALDAGMIPEIIIFSRKTDLMNLPLPHEGIKIYKVPYKSIQLWSNLTTTPGLMGIFKTPNLDDRESIPGAIPLTIICDNVREPGNLGSILRAALGVGCHKVILTKGCVDLWEPKVLRSAAGAHFRLLIKKAERWEDIESLIDTDANVFIADNIVNMKSNADELDSKIKSEMPSEETSINEDDDNVKTINPQEGQSLSVSSEFIQPRNTNSRILRDIINSLPLLPYYAMNYTQKHNILIIGGETEGISYNSYRFTKLQNGVRVNIPLTAGVDSLNTGMALGIVAFEVKRQYIIGGNSNK
ncbi:rRNA methyltransferase 3, mitochondrial [Cephus cinctus]|uniref:rRNA methyltransferase 3, mitochondrial n=1 Tax=Cephus cinctus TaxID=211228 RepID=A0AAJ7BT26_CEPCN|nr:rRNA methyltransferase 3, mitochondrial [Cephus cinctus]